MQHIIVYTNGDCSPYRATLCALERAVDISADRHARDFVMSLGHVQAPIVLATHRHWCGFPSDHIDNLAREVA